MSEVEANLAKVEARIEAACAACGRSREEVTLVAVSKKKPAEEIREAYQAGQRVFGENRVQEAMVKIPELPSGAEWHLVGHLQTNKVKNAVHCGFDLIHSVDSERLLTALGSAASEHGRGIGILLQVNVSGEARKYGLAPEELALVLETAAACPHLEVRGLMTMPPFTEDPEAAAPHFARLRDLRDRASAESGFPLEELSMGMSRDLEAAIREGATLVRVGTDIFGVRR